MNDSWEEIPNGSIRYRKEELVMRYRKELVMGLYETVEIQSGHIIVKNDMVYVEDKYIDPVRSMSQVWTLPNLRNIVAWHEVRYNEGYLE